MKTSELILDIALILFNQRGEPLVTSVDLANEVNISPGNLYYHFKGKQEIIEELYARFHAKLSLTLDEMEQSKNSGERPTQLAYIVVLAKIFAEYRFLCRDIDGICERYSEIRSPFTRLVQRFHSVLKTTCKTFLPAGYLESMPRAPELMADNILSAVLTGGGHQMIEKHGLDEGTNDMEGHILIQLLPFLKD